MGLLLLGKFPLLALDDAVADNEDKDDDDTGDDAEDAASRHDDREDDQHVQRPRHAFREHGDGLEN